jgi:hypothetical protein
MNLVKFMQFLLQDFSVEGFDLGFSFSCYHFHAGDFLYKSLFALAVFELTRILHLFKQSSFFVPLVNAKRR